MRRVLCTFLSMWILSLSVASASPFSDRVKAISWQLFVREWGRLTAICSAGAYWTDGKITRLLTAAHCVTLTQFELGKAVEFMVTQTGADFQRAKVLASGWKIKDFTPYGRSLAETFGKLPSAGIAKPYMVNDRIDIEAGDWAILEIEGQKSVAALGKSADLSEESEVFMFGFPLGGDRFFAKGYVANVNYQAPQTEWPTGYIAADITAAPGNSGSLVLNANEQAIAILVAGAGDRLHILTGVDMVRKRVPCLAEPICAFLQK